jgi:hypothetical protein
LIGYRHGIAAALAKLEVPFVVWHERAPVRRAGKPLAVHIAPYSSSKLQLRRELAHLLPHGPFTHVIAGSEAAVVCAAGARGLLDARRPKHTAVQRCRDKLLMKQHLAQVGIPMTDFLPADPEADPEQILSRLGAPVVVKWRRASGGRGIAFSRDAEELRAELAREKILERYVNCPEASVESFVSRGEVLFASTTEYYIKKHVNVVPAELGVEEREELLRLNTRVIEALRIEWGVTHLEVYRTGEGLLFGEIAIRPPGGYIMDLISLAWQFDAWRAFVSVELDLPDLRSLFPTTAVPARYAAAMVIHPGAGLVRSVEGLAEIRAHPAVVAARVKVKPGDRVEPRTGVGEDVGYVLLRADSRSQLMDALAMSRETLRIEMQRAAS